MGTFDSIRLRGVRQNNLKGFDLDLPLGKLICVTGLSGTGKSSLVFETLHAEGQRRYVETFSPYTRQFLEMLDRPEVDAIENIRPSIAIEQSNTVKTSRSTVGTMTELCDYFKVWFCHVSQLHDPDTGEIIEDDNPASIWKKALVAWPGQEVLLTFKIDKPEKLVWPDILGPVSAQGYTRLIAGGGVTRIENFDTNFTDQSVHVVADKLKLADASRARFLEAAAQALHFGQGELFLFSAKGSQAAELGHFSEGLHSPATGKRYRPARAGLFSFNSPIGACPKCRGFGRVIEIDYRLVIPDTTLSIEDGAIRAFQGQVYSESLRDLVARAKKKGVPTNLPWADMSETDRQWVMEGEPDYEWDGAGSSRKWYGVKRFFDWLESTTYKMHVRVFLSKFRSYTTCPECHGSRLVPEAMNWKWHGHTLPELYQIPVSDLLERIEQHAPVRKKSSGNGRAHQSELAHEAILTRLRYLNEVGLGYLTLDRASRTLSGGEVERVNLTTCLGTALVDTLFVLDEPSVGLHSRDIDRLVSILRRLTDAGNTVVVVEHDEAVMRAADQLIELGPEPGSGGGQIVFQGTPAQIYKDKKSLTGGYLSGRLCIDPPTTLRSVKDAPRLSFKAARKHNLRGLDVEIPLGRFVALSGVSGSGKSTLLNNVIHQGLLAKRGKMADDPAEITAIAGDESLSDIVLVDQSPVSKTPRSNAALYCEAWDDIRQQFARTETAQAAGLTASHFSFNSGQGRCEHCQGLGYERIEMQFLADVFVPCPVCEGKRFKPEVLAIRWNGKSVSDVLALDVNEAITFFAERARIVSRLRSLADVGLGYLTLGQPLNTLSGGECQRLKLVKYLARAGEENALLLLDEPTTGLHRDDVKRLITVLQKLVDAGHSLVVIEHQLDMLRCADWLIELGPEAGSGGGQVIFQGTPAQMLKASTTTSPFLKELCSGKINTRPKSKAASGKTKSRAKKSGPASGQLRILGAREHNLRNLDLSIPQHAFNVVTGVSGSGKSSLAFDIVFAEGQRRFMESMSAYARQFVEQLQRPDIDDLSGVQPTVAIEQRVTRGSRKSTVATITEVAQYLRLLTAKVGVQHSPVTGEPLVAMSRPALRKKFRETLSSRQAANGRALYLCAPVVRARKGHHEPLANWARDHGFTLMRCDGELVELDKFQKLDRYREHDIELVWELDPANEEAAAKLLGEALKHGKGACFILSTRDGILSWFSTTRTDPATGEAYPELDPKHFSWNSAKGWCPACHGYGRIFSWMHDHEDFQEVPEDADDGEPCPTCEGTRLNPVSRSVLIDTASGKLSLPQLLALPPQRLLETLRTLRLDTRGKRIAREIVPEVEERLKFMDRVGLGYLCLDRATNTLSGGEAQRIRLAAQLGSNLSGVLYVLDEPSIGLHARDNDELIRSLLTLRDKGNTLLVVEHDDDTMRAADNIIDLGPGAGIHGGRLLAEGPYDKIIKNPDSLTGQYLKDGIAHPLRGAYRALPKKWTPRSKTADWLVLRKPALRNLKGEDLRLPLARLIMVCGISGAGKSTLMRGLLKPAVEIAIAKKSARLTGADLALPCQDLVNGNAFRAVIEVDQEPIGKTPRSTPATYIGAFDIIRQFFASLPEAKIHGYTAGHFSFNTKGGRCETCQGAGRIKLEMSFLPDQYVPCEDCHGTRYGPELADIRWNGKTIADVLAMSFEEAAEFFSFHSRLSDMLGLMVETGLGYLTLGQSSPTLSGGEAQRLKLVSELSTGLPSFKEKSRGLLRRNLYLLEEPTIGLHMSDCERLIELLHRLVEQGHTVAVIEHNLDLIAEADYVVEVGPEGGESGGHILYQGALPGLLKTKSSPTAPYLKEKL
ncbi:excinuclease ABC subunit UvrA [Ruficoccus amylovorans]|uniref:UvrABC system protein A n=1 Tax=Ruficoccus amylovorans TaxID=1804625 RepID=A0A842HGI5_9BACT|nr:excinuclease ABC subunit UvrA [Ruficoccus amylovorans]MBC2594736.1 excinuclease ABC subunit UvrA [Ruficoccus amylovorans]